MYIEAKEVGNGNGGAKAGCVAGYIANDAWEL
jgi:hypothetical protein